MLSALQQKTVWESWLAAEIRAYYFGDLVGYYQRRQDWATWLLLLSSSGAVATLITEQISPRFSWARIVLTVATAALSLWSLVAQNSKRVTDCADLHFRWNTLANRYEALWGNMYASDAAETLLALKQTAAEISKSSTGLRLDKVRLGKWQDLVEAHHRGATLAA